MTGHVGRVRIGFLVICVIAFVAASTWSCILFKMAANAGGTRGLLYYIVGNLVAAIGPLALTLALKRMNPNVIFAVCYGASFACLQLVSWRMFNVSLSPVQWTGIAAVGLGICLMQLRP